MPKLKIVTTSTSKQRQGPAVAMRFAQHAKFEVENVDLKVVNLPPLDDPRGEAQ